MKKTIAYLYKWLTLLRAKQDSMSYNQVNNWPLCGSVGKPSHKKGIKTGPNGRKGIKTGLQKNPRPKKIT